MKLLPVMISFALLQGCSSPPSEPPTDLVGTWTADFLLNTKSATSGPDVSPFGTLTFGVAKPTGGADEYIGNASAQFKVFAVQGTVDMPLSDADGEPLYEEVGTAFYAGTWLDYTPLEDIDVSLSCEKIEIVASRPDIQVVCGAPGFEANSSSACNRPEGSEILQCFGQVFNRQ